MPNLHGVDISKIKEGDEVLLKGRILKIWGGFNLHVRLTTGGVIAHFDDIQSHTPAPRPFILGEKVKFKTPGLHVNAERIFTIEGISACKKWLWLKNSEGSYTTLTIEGMVHVE